jgi:hypothetical protein
LRRLVRLVSLLAVAGVTVGCPGVAGAGPAGDAEASADELLERAREAAQAGRFTGEVEVEWRDGRDRRRARVPVEAAGGVLRLGDGVVGTGFQRMVRGSKGWLMLWSHEVAAAGPSPRAKYSFSVLPGPTVASRPTRMIEVRLVASAGRLRERVYLDPMSGLLLRREMLDARGEPYRSVGYLTIAPSQAPAPATPRSRAREPLPTGSVAAPYRAPRRLGDGYQLLGSYQKRGAVHLFYSDGLHGLSVFEQRGRLGPWGRGGRAVELMGRTVRAYSTAAGEAAVWEGDGIVYTIVSDGSWQDLAAAARALPHSARSGRLRKVAEVVVSLFRWR